MKIRRVSSISLLLLLLTVTINFYSCSDDSVTQGPEAPVTSTLIHLDSSYAIGGRALVSLYVEDSLHVGYNPVYVVLHDSVTGVLITDAHVEFDLLNHGHSTPVENPESNTAVDGKFKGAWILNASQAGDNPLHWHYTVMVHNHEAPGEPEGAAEFSEFVVKEDPDGFKSIIMPDSTALYLSYITPRTPVTGANSFEFLINKNEPELFPPDGTYTIEMTTEYLANGHTTTNNVNPVGNSIGHYNGTVNLDQNGAWRIKLKLIKNTLSYDTYFDITY
ncbi:MAG: hypothetical protein ABI462_09505 [Ignavibacteria bacterium]